MAHLKLRDGRRLHYQVSVPEGEGAPIALVFHHGQPGAALLWDRMVVEAGRHGWGVVMLSRPGYATSERQPGRLVADVVADVEALLNRLNFDRFVVAGWSGGGPHALACAALLESRCAAAATIAGVAPYQGADDLDWTAGMGPENVAEFHALIAGDPELESRVLALVESLREVRPEGLVEAFGGLLSDPDRRVLEDPQVAAFMAAWMRLAASGGHFGYWDDDLAFVRDWGFELGQLSVPVTVWWAGEDLMVPPSHGEWLAGRIPGALGRPEPAEGHISLLVGRLGEILDQLAADAGVP